jgi:antitoxin ParD1/3/4
MKKFVEQQVTREGYSTASEYVRALIRQDQDQRVQQKLEAKLLEGIASGKPTEMKRKDWDEIRELVIKRHQNREGAMARRLDAKKN